MDSGRGCFVAPMVGALTPTATPTFVAQARLAAHRFVVEADLAHRPSGARGGSRWRLRETVRRPPSRGHLDPTTDENHSPANAAIDAFGVSQAGPGRDR
jgi:hypothetical protein